MCTLSVFSEMSGITETSALEITSERAQQIVQAVSARHQPQLREVSVSLEQVSTYVVEAKNPGAGSAYVSPKQPAFASHWGIVVGDLHGPRRSATLFHLVLKDDEDGNRRIVLDSRRVMIGDKYITGAVVKNVGTTRFEHRQLEDIGDEMIKEFGNYHMIFWNCQMFAKCYLRVITGNDAVFNHWTSADVTNLFLCALVIPGPLATSKVVKQGLKEKRLEDTGTRAAALFSSNFDSEQCDMTEEQLFRISDRVIDEMIESWEDDEALKILLIKDSSNKSGLLKRLWSLFSS
jgi:hypothetical protein